MHTYTSTQCFFFTESFFLSIHTLRLLLQRILALIFKLTWPLIVSINLHWQCFALRRTHRARLIVPSNQLHTRIIVSLVRVNQRKAFVLKPFSLYLRNFVLFTCLFSSHLPLFVLLPQESSQWSSFHGC